MQSNDTTTLPIEIAFDDLVSIEDPVVIDCRTCDEYALGHINNAVNIPLQHLSISKDSLPCSPDDNIVVYCRTGNRSFSFATYLRSIGYDRCQSIEGGFEMWGEQAAC